MNIFEFLQRQGGLVYSVILSSFLYSVSSIFFPYKTSDAVYSDCRGFLPIEDCP